MESARESRTVRRSGRFAWARMLVATSLIVGSWVAAVAHDDASLTPADAQSIVGGCSWEPNRQCIRNTTCSENASASGLKCPDSYTPPAGSTDCPQKPCLVGCTVNNKMGEGYCGEQPWPDHCRIWCEPSNPAIPCGAQRMGRCDYTYNSESGLCMKAGACNYVGDGAPCPDMHEGCTND